ncbi:MAG: hypothetical protein ACMUHB_01135 [Thermoplasmatota archaeon]
MKRWTAILVSLILVRSFLPSLGAAGEEEGEFELFGFVTFSILDHTNMTMDKGPEYSTYVSHNAAYKTYTRQIGWLTKNITEARTEVVDGKRMEYWYADIATHEEVVFLGGSGNISEDRLVVWSHGHELHHQDEDFLHYRKLLFNTNLTTIYKQGEEHSVGYMDLIETREFTRTRTEGGPKFPISMGDSWSERVEYEYSIEKMTRKYYDDETPPPWNTSSTSGTYSSHISYKADMYIDAVSPDGMVRTLRVRVTESEEDDQVYRFYTEEGLLVREEYYEKYGPLYKTYFLTEYRFGGLEDDDGDGILNYLDHYPLDPNKGKDSDGDGVDDTRDDFSNNSVFSFDGDGDGYPDRINPGREGDYNGQPLRLDEFPDNPSEWVDSDGDLVGDNGDSFPLDPAASKDSDHDGYPDEWNQGMTAADSPTDLELDHFPEDPMKWESEELIMSGGSSSVILIAVAIAVLLLAAFVVVGVGIFIRFRQGGLPPA